MFSCNNTEGAAWTDRRAIVEQFDGYCTLLTLKGNIMELFTTENISISEKYLTRFFEEEMSFNGFVTVDKENMVKFKPKNEISIYWPFSVSSSDMEYILMMEGITI